MNTLVRMVGRCARLLAATLPRGLHISVLVTIIVLSACSAAPGSLPAASGASAASGEPASSAAPLPDELSAEDEALVAELQAEGYSEAEALFIALTEVEVESLGEYSQRILYAFPTGNSADLTVTLVPDQPNEAVETGALVMTSSETDGGFSFELEYFIPYDSMPADVRDEVANGTATVDARLALAGMVPLTGPVAASDGIGVIIDGVVDKIDDATVSAFLKFLDKQAGPSGVLDKFYKAVKAGLAVKDALAMGEQHDELQRQLDALEECARNPTNPHTQTANRDDPGYLDRILEQIASVREEVKAVTAVMFIAKMNQTAAGLLSKKVPWLSFVVGPLTSWSKAALDGVNAKLISDLKKSIQSCEEDYRIDKTVTFSQMSITYSIRYTATKCSGHWGEWLIDSAGTLSGGGGTATIGGPLAVTIPEGATSGPVEGTASFSAADGRTSEGRFTGTAVFLEDPATLELTITTGGGGGGDSYSFGFLETGVMGPGTLTFPLERGDFCE